MLSPDFLQHRIGHGLRIDADAGDTVCFQNRQFLFRDGIRAAGFYGKFHELRQIKLLFHRADQRIQLLSGERCGSAAPEIDGNDTKPQRLHYLRGGGDLL